MQAAQMFHTPQGVSSSQEPAVSKCQHCRFYQPEGRRGGGCEQLGVIVQSSWIACGLAEPPFVWAKDTVQEEPVFVCQLSFRETEPGDRRFTSSPSCSST